jgi:hypothetical protein
VIMPGENGVVVTLTDIYTQLISLSARVDAALVKHERVEQLVGEHDVELRPLIGAAERLVDHEARLRQLERSRWPIASVTVLAAVGSLAVAILVAVYGPAGK